MPNLKNSILVELYDLAIAPDSKKCFGKVVTRKFLKEEDLVKIAVKRRTELNASTLKAAIDILKEIAEEEILNGASVSFGPGVFKLAVNGAFDPNQPEWNYNEHKVVLQVSPATQLYKQMDKVEVKVRGMAQVNTAINQVRDVATGKINTCITRGNALELKGTKMKIAGDNPANGITLKHIATGKPTIFRAENLAANYPKKILLVVPLALEPGDYQLEITTQFSNASTLTKEPRIYRLSYILKAD
jgi:hypothetical protein